MYYETMRHLRTRFILFFFILLFLITIALMMTIHAVLWIRGLPVLWLNGLNMLFSTPPPPVLEKPIGGIGPSLYGTIVTSLIAIGLSTPISIILAFVIVEYSHRRIARVLRLLYSALYGIPTIMISMIIYTVLVLFMGTQSLLAGALSLFIIAVPLQTSYFENIFMNVPRTYREAGYSMGMSKGMVLWRIALGIGRAGVVSSLIIVLARVMSETAALLFTVGNNIYTVPQTLLQPGSTITLLIFTLASSPYTIQIEFAWGASFVLYLLCLVLMIISKLSSGVKL